MTLLLALVLSQVAAPPDAGAAARSWRDALATGVAALQAGKPLEAAPALEAAAALHAPEDFPELLWARARLAAATGALEPGRRALASLAALGVGTGALRSQALASLLEGQGAPWRARLEALQAPVVASARAFALADRTLLPESLAYDERDRRYLVGSLTRGAIVARRSDGAVRDFLPPGHGGISSVVGVKVDARRRWLWAAARAGSASVLVAWSLGDGKEQLRREVKTPGRHFLNDLVVDSRGAVLVTDSEGDRLWEWAPGAAALRELAVFPGGSYANGIALSTDEAAAYVALDVGLVRVDRRTGAVEPVPTPPHATLAGIDGLYRVGQALVGVQNGVPGPARVLFAPLSADGRSVSEVRVLEANHPDHAIPTTGVVVGHSLVYLANAQLDLLGPDGTVAPDAPLSSPVFLELPLPPR